MLKIGSHISFKSPNYLVDSIKESIDNGANTVMIYLGPPQSTKRVEKEKYNLDTYNKEFSTFINPIDIVVHAPYIINLANIEKSEFSKKFLISEIKRMNYIGAKFLVLHPGAFVKQNIEESLDHLALKLKEIINETKEVTIVLETMSGKGTELGKNLEELKYLIEKIDEPNRLGICLDTCHLWDAGYDIKNNLDSFIDELKKLELIHYVKVVHLNDSKNDINSHKDRHENIGKGFIGLQALKKFANHPLFDNIPIILETPWVGKTNIYKQEIELIKSK